MFITSTAARQTLYLALVRCHYGYGSPIWAPQTIELISMLERTQRRATKYILNLPFLTNVDYNTRLQSLYLLPISYWLEYLDMTFSFKITHGMIETSVVPVTMLHKEQHGHHQVILNMLSQDVKPQPTSSRL